MLRKVDCLSIPFYFDEPKTKRMEEIVLFPHIGPTNGNAIPEVN